MYGLRVVAVPTHRPRARVDRPVRVYIQRAGKRRMLYALIQESTWRRQPMLIGTGSVADSEEISGWLHDWCARLGSRPRRGGLAGADGQPCACPGRALHRRAAADVQGRAGAQGTGVAVSPLPSACCHLAREGHGARPAPAAAREGAAGGEGGARARAGRCRTSC